MVKKCGIYKITSPSGKIYIGQSKDINHRFYRYRTYQCSRQPKLHASLVKYSSECHHFNIVHELPIDIDRRIMDVYEQFYISQLIQCGSELLNLNEGGKTNQELSESTRKKLSESAKGKKYWLGRKHTEEAKEKIRIGNTGKIFTKERLKKMSDSQIGKPGNNKGKPMSEEAKRKLSISHTGKVLSADTRRKISESGKGRVVSEVTKNKIKEAWAKKRVQVLGTILELS